MFSQAAANPSSSMADHKMFDNPRTPDRIIDLPLSLEELCYSHQIQYKLVRTCQNEYGQITEEIVTIEIPIKAGWKAGTKITFEKMGNSTFLLGPGNVIFVVSQKEHFYFKRKGDDLVIRIKLSYLQAVNGGEFKFKDILNGTLHKCTFQPLLSSKSTTLINGYGMPLVKNPQHRGDLIVKFTIYF